MYGVPQPLRNAVKVLNEALDIDPAAVTRALDTSTVLSPESRVQFFAHPTIVCGGASDEVASLSGLGLINGIIGTDKLRLYVSMNRDGDVYNYFGVVSMEE